MAGAYDTTPHLAQHIQPSLLQHENVCSLEDGYHRSAVSSACQTVVVVGVQDQPCYSRKDSG